MCQLCIDKVINSCLSNIQGVSLEDIEKAEESIHRGQDSSSPSVHDGPAANVAATTQAKSVDNGDVTMTTTSSSSTSRASDPDAKEDRLMTSAFRRRASEDKAEVNPCLSYYSSLFYKVTT